MDYTKDQIQDVEKPGVETDLQKARFEGVKSNFAYDICVLTQINGQTVAKSSIQAQNGIVMPEFAELQARSIKRGVTTKGHSLVFLKSQMNQIYNFLIFMLINATIH